MEKKGLIGASLPKWTPVAQELPKDDEEVLLLIQLVNGKLIRNVGAYYADAQEWVTRCQYVEIPVSKGCEVIGWMRMDMLPEEPV